MPSMRILLIFSALTATIAQTYTQTYTVTEQPPETYNTQTYTVTVTQQPPEIVDGDTVQPPAGTTEVSAPEVSAQEVSPSGNPCEATLKVCGADFTGTCAAGQTLANGDKECPGGICTVETCCRSKFCDKAQTDVLCVGQWYPKVLKASDYQFSKLDASDCPAGLSATESLEECQKAAAFLNVTFIKEINSERFPHGCFQCISSKECSALQDLVPLSQSQGLFWNNEPRSLVKDVSDIRHAGTREPCRKDPPGCAATGCTAETCCLPLTCGTNFKDTCLAGEMPKDASTLCNEGSQVRSMNCSRSDCCQAKTCSQGSLNGVCTDGWVVAPEQSTATCPASGCDKTTCCREEMCSTDFKGTCAPGETLLATTPCPGKGCSKETCCAPQSCANFTCSTECSMQWLKKKETLFCLPTGCSEQTCCELPICAFDFKGTCQAGEVIAEEHTVCPGGKCTADVCCIPKTCDGFTCSGNGLKPRPFGTLCSGSGCDETTCCDIATCGGDFGATECGPWATTKPADTICPSGVCDKSTCCEKKECIIRQAACNVEKIKGTGSFSVYDTQFPNANHNADDAEGACASLDRSECFATMDVNCDGSELLRCTPKHANDPSSIVLRPSTKSCVCYRPEQPTCGYNMAAGVTCGAGEKVDFYAVCGGDSGRACDAQTCCTSLTCESSFFRCPLGSKMTDESAVCPQDGCSTSSCCTPLTCSADFKGVCPPGTSAAPEDPECVTGACTVASCCVEKGITTPPPTVQVCGTNYHGACGAGQEFMPTVPCGAKSPVKADSESFVLGTSGSADCPDGYFVVTDAAQCITGITYLSSQLKLTDPMGNAMPSAPGALAGALQSNTIPADPAGQGSGKPYGCYYDTIKSADSTSGSATEVFLNLDHTGNAASSTSQQICASFASMQAASVGACSRETCCRPIANLMCAESFTGCTADAGLAPKSDSIMCPASGCTTDICCRPTRCADFFSIGEGAGTCVGTEIRLPVTTPCNGACSAAACCAAAPTTPPPSTSFNPCTTGAPQPLPRVEPPQPLNNCGSIFALGDTDTTTCPVGFVQINSLEKCVAGAQFLRIQPSDTNGDGSRVNFKDTQAMTKWLATREIQADDTLGIHKPTGCFADISLRVVKGDARTITTIWLNHRVDGAGKHDNSAPICQQDCDGSEVFTTPTTTVETPSSPSTTLPPATTSTSPAPCTTLPPATTGGVPCTTLPPSAATCGHTFAMGAKDSDQCPAGFEKIETVEECVEGAMHLGVQPSDVNGDGNSVDSKDKAGMTNFVTERVITANDNLGIHKPHGCFKDDAVRLVEGKIKKITTIWLNHVVEGSGKHDNSSPICKEVCAQPATAAMLQKYEGSDEMKTRQQGDSNGTIVSFVALSFAGFLGLLTCFHRRFGRRYAQTRSFSSFPRDEPAADANDLIDEALE